MGFISDIIKKGYGGYTGWNDEASAQRDYEETGGQGKWTGLGSSGGSSGIDASGMINQQKEDFAALMAKQETQEGDFLKRFRETVEGLEPLGAMRERLISERYPEYGAIKEGAYGAAENLRKIPGAVEERAGQVGMAANRIQARITAKVNEIQPFVTDSLSKLEFIEGQLGQAFQLEAADRENALIPLQQEAAMISDRLTREITGYTTVLQSQTSILVQELATQGALEVQELKNLADAALAEQMYFDSQFTEKDGRKVLMNMTTGQIIVDLGPAKSSGGIGNINDDITNALNEITPVNSNTNTNILDQGGYPSAWG